MTRLKRLKPLRSLLITFLALSCGDTPLGPTTIRVGPDGGTFEFLNGLVTMVVPAGAVESDTALTARLATGVPSSGRLVPGSAVELEPDGMTFLVPVTLTVNLGARKLPTGVRPAELRVFTAVNGQWQLAPGVTAPTTDGVLTAQISSFSTYGVLGVPVTSVTVSAASSVPIGGETQASATPRDANQQALPDRTVSWATSNAQVATVNQSGLIVGVNTGTATITATSEGVEGSAVVVVSSSGVPGVWLEEDFSTYGDINNFLTNPRGIYTDLSAASEGNEVFGRAQFTLESTGFGSLTKSLRFNFPDRTADTAARCQDYSIGVNLSLPTPATEIWVEVVAQYSSNFTTRAPAEWGCTSNPDHKFIFGRTSPSGRFNLDVGTGGGQWTWGYPGAENNEFGWASSPFDGMWHTYRLHMKTSSTGTGAATFWYDGTLTKSFVNVTTTGQSIYGIAIGRNLNQGPASPQSVTIGRVRIWNANPGF